MHVKTAKEGHVSQTRPGQKHTIKRCYDFGREVTFSIQVAIIVTSNTLLNIIIQYI